MRRSVYPSFNGAPAAPTKLLNGFQAVKPGATRWYQQRMAQQVDARVTEAVNREAVNVLSSIIAAAGAATTDAFTKQVVGAAVVLAATAFAEAGNDARALIERGSK